MERPDSWFEPDCHSEYECDSCSDYSKAMENAKEFLESVVEMMYSKNELDISLFENHLEEACSYLGILFPLDDIQIKRK